MFRNTNRHATLAVGAALYLIVMTFFGGQIYHLFKG